MRQGLAVFAALLLLLASAAAASARSKASNKKGAPQAAGLPTSLQPDVLNLDACPDCITWEFQESGDPNEPGSGQGVWTEPKRLPIPGEIMMQTNGANTSRVVALSGVQQDACNLRTDSIGQDGRLYCPNSHLLLIGCTAMLQSNLTVTSTQQKRRKTITTEKPWGPATDAAAPFTIVLISRLVVYEDEEPIDCKDYFFLQTLFTTSRDAQDTNNQIVWKNKEISLYSDDTGFALQLFYGSDIPCPLPNKWRMEVLTRDPTGTSYTYYRYTEGQLPYVSVFQGLPVILGADKLGLGYDERGRGLNRDRNFLEGSIAVFSIYNRQLSADEVETLAQYHSCRFNLATETCPPVEGYTALAGVDHKGDDLIKRCKSFRVNKDIDIAQEGAALCDEDPACVGFTTWVQGRKAWTCPKTKLDPVVAAPLEKSSCIYTKAVEAPGE